MSQHDTPTTRPGVVLTGGQRMSLRRAMIAALLIGVVMPIALALTSAILLITWLPLTPDPVATHWSGSAPDGFTGAGANIFLVSGMSAGLGLLIGGIAVYGSGRGAIAVWSAMNRFLAALGLSVSALISALGVLSTHMQLGLADAKLAGSIGGPLGLAFAFSVAAGVLGYVVQPKVYIAGKEGAPAPAVALAATERAVWVGMVRPSRGLTILLAATILLILGATFVAWMAAPSPVLFWTLTGLVVLLSGLFACSLWFRVRIDAQGVEARSTAGWPVFRVPTAEVAHVAVSSINPLSDFGGWGMRWAPGRFGLVMRAGEGIVITRRDGRIFALTIDDAETAAGLLEAYAGTTQDNGDNR